MIITQMIYAQVPLPLSTFANKRILFITAHPDDVEGFSGDTVAALQKMKFPNLEIKYLILTSGNAGGLCYNDTAHYQCNPETNKEELAFALLSVFPPSDVFITSILLVFSNVYTSSTLRSMMFPGWGELNEFNILSEKSDFVCFCLTSEIV